QSGPVLEIIEPSDTLRSKCLDLSPHARLLGCVERKQIAGPEHHPCRRLRAAEDHRGALIADFLIRKGFTRVGVLEIDQKVEQILAVGRSRLRRACCNDGVNGCKPSCLKALALSEGEREGAIALGKDIE